MDLLPLFRQRKVQFSDLMSLTETELDMVCVGVDVSVYVLISIATLNLLVCL